jgi:hypothetical protein
MSVILPMLACRGSPWRNAALAWLWVLPAYIAKFTVATGILVTPLVVSAALILASNHTAPTAHRNQKFFGAFLQKSTA